MRRTIIFAAALAVAGIFCVSSVQARGLYKGHGRISPRTLHNPWAVRINGAFGFQGAFQASSTVYDPVTTVPVYSFSDWKFGYYGTGGIEFNLGQGWSIEPYGLYRRITDPNNIRVFATAGSGLQSFRNIDSRVYGAGVNFRIYKNWRGGAAYLGVGGGYAHGEAEWASLRTEIAPPSSAGSVIQQDSGDFQVMTGVDFHVATALSLGFELGWRWSGLDGFNEFEGGFGGARVGFMFGDGD